MSPAKTLDRAHAVPLRAGRDRGHRWEGGDHLRRQPVTARTARARCCPAASDLDAEAMPTRGEQHVVAPVAEPVGDRQRAAGGGPSTRLGREQRHARGPLDELDNGGVEDLRIRGAHEVLTFLDDSQLSVRGIDEPADLILGVTHRVHPVGRALQPQHRTPHLVQPAVQTVAVAQVDADRAKALASGVAGVVPLMFGVPERPSFCVDPSPSPSKHRVDELGRYHPVIADGLGEGVDRAAYRTRSRPAAEVAAARALEVHGRAERNDALHDVRREHRHACGDPATLRGAQHECLGDAERLEDRGPRSRCPST